MTKLYLHAGMPKTGTSYIQSCFNVNREYISKAGGVLILANRLPHNLACNFIDSDRLISRKDIYGLKREVDIDDLAKLLDKSNGFSKTFISSEYFHIANKEKLVDFLKRFYDEIEIVYTVRRQDELLASGYNQDVKALSRTTNLNWKNTDKVLDYYETCNAWLELGCSIKIIPYDQIRYKDKGLESEFLQLLDIAPNCLSELKPISNGEGANYSLSAEGVKLKLALNRKNMDDFKLISDFSRSELAKSDFLLPKIFSDSVKLAYFESNRKFISKFCEGEEIFGEEYMCLSQDAKVVDSFDWDPTEGVKNLLDYLICSYRDSQS
ncbi:hypothetical protein ACJJIW_02180 [Microbulbifer sp. JMSA004]|uniref:hypothetical protein n=1 Tax=unclassified Microbulbifer TaxID=2619833 RepID=UPI00403AB4DA